jgi:hypothetical protein
MDAGRGKVFGVGWAKTGTTTLGDALTILGYRHQSARLDLVQDLADGDLSRILSVARQHDSFEDWPWLLLFRELDREFPASKFVLTTRDPAAWLASYRNMLARKGEATDEVNERRRILYGLPFPDVDDQSLLERYSRHEREVRAHFRDRPGHLIVVDWAQGDGWPELCAHLGLPVPDRELPHANRGVYDR